MGSETGSAPLGDVTQGPTLARGCAASVLAAAGLLGLVVLGVYVFVAGPPNEAGTPRRAAKAVPRVRSRVFEDTAHGCRFEAPAHWVVVTRGGAFVLSGPVGAADSNVTLAVQVSPRTRTTTLEGQVAEAKRQWAGLPGYELRAQRTTRLRGLPAASLRAAYEVKARGRFMQQQWIVARDPDYYWIGYTAPERLFDAYAGVLDHALETLELASTRR